MPNKFFAIALWFIPGLCLGTVRLKDIANIGGARDIELIGYGLVTGLDGTGDKAGSFPTVQSLANMLRRLGVIVSQNEISGSNVAAVVVTARVPTYAPSGAKLDATISSLGSATSLRGGTLLLTPLRSIEGKTIASAQGKVVTEAAVSDQAKRKTAKSVFTVGSLPSGVLLESDISASLLREGRYVDVLLQQPDFLTAQRVSEAVHAALKTPSKPLSPARIEVDLPTEFADNPVPFIAQLETVLIDADSASRIVINERTGTVISGQNVELLPVSISHGNLKIDIDSERRSVVMLQKGSTINTLISMLNGIGVSAPDITMIFKTLQRVGALKAQVDIL